ncbi:RNA polymerase sigma factor [Acinetobacter pittii]|uniref:RNA polymerase sigma factor n=1 Tax=Acinetobacter pittii TaxID=48296 RepID=UPI0020432B13|nr:hypothetical protein [Acinetobacter pittii]
MRDESVREDLVQESLVRLLVFSRRQTIENFAAAARFIAWNVMRDHFRRHRRTSAEPLDQDYSGDAPLPDQVLLHKQRLQRFIEICLIVQKERLKEKVVSIVEYDQGINVREKLKQLYFLHTDVEGMYYLLFKAMFETKLTYPKAYITAVRYRTWLLNEIYSQLIKLKTDATFQDAKLFLYMVEGTIIQLLSSDEAIDREKMLDCFLNANKTVNAFEYKQ